jgi:hypothetical protein
VQILNENLDFVEIFRSPAHRIEIAIGRGNYFSELHKSGPFCYNSHLEHLSISINLNLSRLGPDFVPNEESDWMTECVPIYSTALQYLHELNPSLVLEVGSELMYNVFLQVI